MQQASYRSSRGSTPRSESDFPHPLALARILAGELVALASLITSLATALVIAAVFLP